MTGLLFFVTLMLDLISVACVGVYLWLNNFTLREDMGARNKSLKIMSLCAMIGAIVLAFLTGVLSGSGDPAAAIKLSVTLYIIIAVSMLIVIFASCGILIYRMVSKREMFADKPKFWQIVLMAAIGAVVCAVLIWLMS